MREMEIDLTDPMSPILWVKEKSIKLFNWKKKSAHELASIAGFFGRRKVKAKDFYKHFGIPASACAKFVNNGLIKMTVGAVKGHEPLCYVGNQFSPNATIAVCEMKDGLDQAVADGIKNITPFIAKLKMTPKQLKEHFGSANWKALCKNSFSRNRSIAERWMANKRLSIEKINKIPSGLLKYRSAGLEVDAYLHKKAGFRISQLTERFESRDVIDARIIVNDTYRMARQYNEKFSFDWSWRKMQEKHNEYSRLAILKMAEETKARKEKFKNTLREGKQKVWTKNGVTATYLDTYDRILKEAVDMHHCVWAYAEQCYDGTYAVVHIEGDNEHSTLGIIIYSGGVHRIQQHYGHSNAEVKSELHKTLAYEVVEFLNKESETPVHEDVKQILEETF